MGSLHPNYTMKILLTFSLLFGISWAQLDCSNCAYNSYQANICCATGNSYCCQFATGNQNQGGQAGGSNYNPGGSNYNPGGNSNPGGSNYNPGTPRPRYIRLNPIFNGNSKRGNCPTPSSRPEFSDTGVVYYCSKDRHCPGQQKCCRRGGNSNLGNKICKQPTFGYYG